MKPPTQPYPLVDFEKCVASMEHPAWSDLEVMKRRKNISAQVLETFDTI